MKRRDKGQVLVLVALAIFVLLGFAALGIDVGFMYSVRHELQRSADAGALAGASAFTTGKWDDPSVQGIAEDRARTFASKDTVVKTLLNRLEPPIGEVHVSFPQYDHIEVVTSRNADLFFARIFGMGNKLITARAVARAEVTDIKSDCVKPFAIPYPWDDNMPPISQMETVKKELVPNGYYDKGPLGMETVWKTPPNLTQGTLMTIKAGVPGSAVGSFSPQQTAGQFFIVQGNNPNPGQDSSEVTHWQASEYRDYIDGTKCWNVSLSNPVDTMTGGKVGSTEQAVQDLIDSDKISNGGTGASWDTASNSPTDNSSRRVIRVIMYDPSIDMIMSGGGGSSGGSGTKAAILANNYTIAGFWLERVCAPSDAGKIPDCPKGSDKAAVIGRYMGIMGPGSSTGNTPPNPTGTENKKIALVE